MTGFCAIVHNSESLAFRVSVEQMLNAVDWHKRTARATWDGDGANFGHIRLAPGKTAANSRQSLHFPRFRVAVIFDGWLENRSQLRDLLAHELAHVTEPADDEIVAAAYRKWGDELPSYLSGQYSVLVWDIDSKSLLAFRDRLGMRGLVYAICGDKLVLASLPVSVVALPFVSRCENLNYLGKRLAATEMPVDATFFRDVHRIPPAHALKWKAGSLRIWRTWQPPPPRIEKIADAEVPERFRAILCEAVLAAIPANEPVALSLSGGIDSTTVCLAAAALCSTGKFNAELVRTVSFAYPGMACDESEYFSEASKKLPFLASSYVGRAPNFTELEELTRKLGEPLPPSFCMMIQGLPSDLNAAGGRVLLTGIGGDELCWPSKNALRELFIPTNWASTAAYLRYVNWATSDSSAKFALLRRLRSDFLPGLRRPHWLLPTGRARPSILAGGWPAETHLAASDFSTHAHSSSRTMAYASSAVADLANVHEWNDAVARLLGIEYREPLQADTVVNFVSTLPLKWLDCFAPRTRWPLRMAFRSEMPQSIFERTSKAEFSEVFNVAHDACINSVPVLKNAFASSACTLAIADGDLVVNVSRGSLDGPSLLARDALITYLAYDAKSSVPPECKRHTPQTRLRVDSNLRFD
jgi:asparagine synthase (glutamine-hydrolysing)